MANVQRSCFPQALLKGPVILENEDRGIKLPLERQTVDKHQNFNHVLAEYLYLQLCSIYN